jgi:TolB protein
VGSYKDGACFVFKRKNDEPRRSNQLFWVVLTAAALALVAISAFALWLWFSGAQPTLLTLPGKITFLASDDKFVWHSEVYSVNANGTQLTKLLSKPDTQFSYPAWSPDGNQLAVASWQKGTTPKLYLMNLVDSLLTKVTKTQSTAIIEWSPTWSPDGKRLAYEIYDSNANTDPYTLWITTLATRQTEQLFPDVSGNKEHPVWSPDGKFIAFLRGEALYIAQPDGSNLHQLVDGQVNRDYAWSPDSRQLAFSSNRNVNIETIFVVDVDGSNLKQLTDKKSSNQYPSWSPDGRFIAFGSDRDGKSKIYIMSSDGSAQRKLTTGDLSEASPVWSR